MLVRQRVIANTKRRAITVCSFPLQVTCDLNVRVSICVQAKLLSLIARKHITNESTSNEYELFSV